MVAALDPTDPDYVDDLKATKESLSSEKNGSGVLTLGSAGGTLVWYLDGKKGYGPCNKTGTGGFYGARLPSGLPSGTYELYLHKDSRTKCELRLSPKGGVQPSPWKGTGAQKGLSNRDGKPWTGKYS